jgi:hypothetical protein
VGVPPATLRELRRLSPGRSTAVALGVLAQLVSRGVPPQRAAAAVTTLVRRGARPGQLAALDAAVQADVAAGVTPARALDGRTRELADGGRLTDGPLVAPLSTAPGGAVGDVVENRGGRPGLDRPVPTGTTEPTSTTPPTPRPPPRRP